MGETVSAKLITNEIVSSAVSNDVVLSTVIGGSLAQKAYSPTVEMTGTEEGVVISITDVDGTKEATVHHGTVTESDKAEIANLAKESFEYDDVPTEGSDHIMTSGDIKTAIDAKADNLDIPTKVSQLENDSGYLTQHQDISGKADKSEIPTKVSDLDNDVGFLTEHQDISGKADKAEIPTKVSDLDNDSGYLTEHQDISSKADKSEIPTKVSQLDNDSGYLTVHQDISDKADKSEIPTKVSQLDNDSGFLTTHQDISSKADKSEIPTKVSDLQNDSGFLTEHQDISGKADKSELPTKVSQLQNDSGYITDISGKQDILTFDSTPQAGSNNPVTSGGIREAVDAKLDAPHSTGSAGQFLTTDGNGAQAWSTFATEGLVTVSVSADDAGSSDNILEIDGLSDIESVNDRFDDVNTALNGKQDILTFDSEPLANSTNPVTSGGVKTALDNKANISDMPTKVSDLQNDSGYLTTHQDISGKQDVLTFDSAPQTGSSNPVTSSGIKTALDAKANTSAIPTKVSDLQNDSGYLTTHQDISGKADKSEIPTKVSDLTNDSGYLTQHQDISGKQNVLTFDSAPQASSTNPVTSGGVYDAVSAKLDAPHSAGSSGQFLTTDGNGSQAWSTFSTESLVSVSVSADDAGPSDNILDIDGLSDVESAKDYIDNGLAGKVDDVQINGTSITSDGVANIPLASATTLGVVKSGNGLRIDGNNAMSLNPAWGAEIREAADYYRPITAYYGPMAAFYGLAKAAGDTTQSQSNNAVGTYTDSAKNAIKTMLDCGIITDTISGTDPELTCVANHRYICGECYTLSVTPPASGIVDVIFTSGTTPTVLTVPSEVKWPSWFDPSSINASTTYELNIMDGVYGAVALWT